MRLACLILLLGLAVPFSSSAVPAPQTRGPLTEDEQILHVLNRLGYGPRPGDIERVRKVGVRAYIDQQLHPERIPDTVADAKLKALKTISTIDVTRLEPVVAKEGVMARSETRRTDEPGERPMPVLSLPVPQSEKNPIMDPLLMADARTMRQTTRTDIIIEGSPIQARIVRAVYSDRQLAEMMADFWFNHFNVTRQRAGDLLQNYEEAVIRKNAFGRFEDLLKGTAQHPAMLAYLDNWRSSAPRDVIEQRINNMMSSDLSGADRRAARNMTFSLKDLKGLNENYGRELLELHTLGVDGGYTQQDVIQAAKAFTGWTVTEWDESGLRVADQFVFNPLLHESGDKVVLGTTIKSAGVQEGMEILAMLARHPSTAHHIATKLVRRFVADDPPADIVKSAEEAFIKSDGNIRETLTAILTHPRFFAPEYYQVKFKKPLELVFSALRLTGSEIEFPQLPRRQNAQAAPVGLQAFLQDMGEPLYNRPTPDGYPDTTVEWLDSNALLKRMDFASAFSVGRMPEAKMNLAVAVSLIRELRLPEPNAAQTTQIRTQMQQAALQREKNAAGQATALAPAMMDANAGKSDRQAEYSAEAIAVAYVLGSPQFQKR